MYRAEFVKQRGYYSILTKKWLTILQRHAARPALHLCRGGLVLKRDHEPEHMSKVCRD